MPRPRSDIRQRVIVAARERFLFEGVDGASLRRIASEARTNIGMVYYYFREKDELLLAVIEDVYVGLMADLERILDPERPIAETLQAASKRAGEMSAEEQMVVRLVIREMLISGTRRDKILHRFSRGHIPLIIGVVMAGIARGEIRADVPPLLAMLTVGSAAVLPQLVIHTIAEGLMRDAPVPDPGTLAQVLTDNILRGLAPKP